MTDEQKQTIDTPEIEQVEEVISAESAAIAELEQKLAESQDQLLRTMAEMQNIRRRADQELDKTRKFALEKFASQLLPIVDSLERGIALSNTDNEAVVSFREGMELTLKMFQDTLKQFQIEQVDPLGEPFNTDTQEAMAMEANPDVEPNTVIKVFQKGYLLNGRLLRPAMVVISKSA